MTNPLAGYYSMRWSVLKRDGFTCQYCGQSAPAVILHVDHVIPKAAGGSDDKDNLVTACSACNIGRNLDGFVATGSRGKPRTVGMKAIVSDYIRRNGPATASSIARNLKRNRVVVAHTILRNPDTFKKLPKQGRNQPYGLSEVSP